MNGKKETIELSTTSVIKFIVAVLLVWFLFIIKDILLILIISIITASAMDPLADYLQKKRIPRGLSVLLVYLVFVGLIVLILFMLVPPIVQEFQAISKSNFYETFREKVGVFRHTLDNLGIGQSVQNNLKTLAATFSNTLFQTTKGVVTGFVSVITILVISFYLTIEENGMKSFIKNLVPFKHQSYAMNLMNRIQKKMGSWVLGQIILSAVIFGLTFIGLSILRVDFALALALIAGLLEVVPYIGPFIAAIPAVFFAFLQNPALAIGVIILYVVVQQLENHIIVPVVMSKSVGLNPVLVILGILVGGTMAGIVGALIAVPIISGVSVFLNDLWENPQEQEEEV
jgi:predicted PurR-regulated permease PerM